MIYDVVAELCKFSEEPQSLLASFIVIMNAPAAVFNFKANLHVATYMLYSA
jgi:hypothetical protein